MKRELLTRGDSGEKPVDRLIETQKSSELGIHPDDLPFDLTAEFGKVLYAELVSPGVYFLSVEERSHRAELYVVMVDAPAISEKAWSYGKKIPDRPDLRIYDMHQPGSGRYIIDFEMCRYRMKHHLPIEEKGDSLRTVALYGMEEHPEYFGTYPVPIFTPRGCTVRHRTLLNGVYWLETDRCEEMLAVCCPIGQADISIPEQNLAELLVYDQVQSIDNTSGYLFFPKQSCYIPLYELCEAHPEISGMLNMAALLNAICKFYPEYTAALNNEEETKYKFRIQETPDAGTEFFLF